MTASKARRQRRAEARIAEYSAAIGAEPYMDSRTSALDKYVSGWTAEIYALALSRRHWTGLPNGVDERRLEKLLALYGEAVVYSDGVVNGRAHYAAAQSSTIAGFDKQENPLKVYATGADGQTSEKLLTPADSVVVYDNMARIPLTTRINQWASDLARIDLERSRNIAMQNAYSLLYVDQSRVDDAKKLVRNQNTGIFGEIAIASDPSKGDPPIVPGTIQTGVTPIMDKLASALNSKLNEVYAQLGIDFIGVEKQERLITQEAAAGQDVVNRHRYYYLEEARQAARTMSDIFGCDCRVTWNTLDAKGETDEPEADTTMGQ